MKKQDDYVRTALRAPRDLHARLHEAAEASGRSFNAEIIARLEASFGQDMDATKTTLRMLMDYINSEVLASKADQEKAKQQANIPLPVDIDDATYEKMQKMADNAGIPVKDFMRGIFHVGLAKKALEELGEAEN